MLNLSSHNNRNMHILNHLWYWCSVMFNSAYWVIFHALSSSVFFSKSTFLKNSFRNTIKVSNSLDPDQARHFVGPDLGPNCLRKLLADDTSWQWVNLKDSIFRDSDDLTYLYLWYFPPLSIGKVHFEFKGCFDSNLEFHSNSKSTFYKQTVQKLIRCSFLQHLIWFCTDCCCPIKWMQGIYGLKAVYCKINFYNQFQLRLILFV